jgi:hypothetical protein
MLRTVQISGYLFPCGDYTARKYITAADAGRDRREGRAVRAGAVVAALAAAACKPDLGAPPSLITEPRVLAVRSDRPRSRPITRSRTSS